MTAIHAPAESRSRPPAQAFEPSVPESPIPVRDPPRGLLRWLLEAPAIVYRLGLGRLFGRRFLLLTHRGRRSGTTRRTVVEVVRSDPATHESFVVAGWGDRTQWYRNVLAAPALRVETGGRRFRPAQRILRPEEVRDELVGYVERNPWAKGVMSRLALDPDGAGHGLGIGHLRGVAFRPDPALDAVDQRARRRRTTGRVYDLLAAWYDRVAEPFESEVRSAGLAMLDARPGESIVEFGSGTGRALEALGWMVGPEGRVRGLDLSARMVAVARQRIDREGLGPSVTAEVGDATASDLPDASTDAVFMAFVLESLSEEDRAAILRETRRILRPDGRFVVVALHRTDRATVATRVYETLNRLFPAIVDCRPMRVRDAVEEAGFEVEADEVRSMAGLPVSLTRGRAPLG